MVFSPSRVKVTIENPSGNLFEEAYQITSRYLITEKYLPQSFNALRERMVSIPSSREVSCLFVDDFHDVKSKSIHHMMGSFQLPSHLSSV